MPSESCVEYIYIYIAEQQIARNITLITLSFVILMWRSIWFRLLQVYLLQC